MCRTSATGYTSPRLTDATPTRGPLNQLVFVDSRANGKYPMKTWTGHPAWREWSQRLAVATGEHFERELLPLLELFWPDISQAPRLKTWDRQGIDLFVWTDSGPFPCVVQCKGFEERELAESQIEQIEKSIDRFRQSTSTAKTYLVVHNREGNNPDVRQRVEPLLAELVRSRKAERAELWDRQRTVNELFGQLQVRLEAALHERSRRSLASFSALFHFGHLYVHDVPAAQRELVFRRDAPFTVATETTPRLISVPETIARSSGVNWTILTGQFGTGKTTGAMRSAASSTRPMLLIPCATVPEDVFSQGATNGLSQHIVDSLDLLPQRGYYQQLRRAAGAVLSYLLRREVSPFVLILDGLDEHHFFSSLQGLQRLSNQLAEFSCAVVLTTRKEHLDTLLGDFNIAFSELGSKFGKRSVTCIDLQRWDLDQTKELVESATRDTPGQASRLLAEFRECLESGEAQARFGDLLHHPLFLHFILEDLISEEFAAATRPELLRRWLARKLRRDRSVWITGTVTARPTVRADLDSDEFITKMIGALEEVALQLTSEAGSIRILEESTTDELVRGIVGRHFELDSVDILPILLNSVLVVHSRTPDGIRVGFALRSLHEYLLAAHLVRHHLDASVWPTSVQSFVDEIRGVEPPI